MALIGYEGFLMFSETLITKYPADSLTPEAGTFNSAALYDSLIDIDDAIDVSPDNADEKVETTTRKLARKGKKGEKTLTSSGTIQFGVSSELLDTPDNMLHKLVKLADAGTKITIVDLNSGHDVIGSWGTVGVYELNKPAAPKTLKGHQVLTFEATLQDWPSNIVVVELAEGPPQTYKFIDIADLA